MPAARDQLPEHRVARGFFIEVKRLRIELLRKGDNVFLVNANAAVRLEHLPDGEILEIPFRHRFDCLSLKMAASISGRSAIARGEIRRGLPFLLRTTAVIIRDR